mmetsp:Transcript_29612/g.71090  ORF Transcript_29612/g.71090 Transcript_29612/m.71090 type:complete len:377 (-) Transcript_29612:1237-2367(-)
MAFCTLVKAPNGRGSDRARPDLRAILTLSGVLQACERSHLVCCRVAIHEKQALQRLRKIFTSRDHVLVHLRCRHSDNTAIFVGVAPPRNRRMSLFQTIRNLGEGRTACSRVASPSNKRRHTLRRASSNTELVLQCFTVSHRRGRIAVFGGITLLRVRRHRMSQPIYEAQKSRRHVVCVLFLSGQGRIRPAHDLVQLCCARCGVRSCGHLLHGLRHKSSELLQDNPIICRERVALFLQLLAHLLQHWDKDPIRNRPILGNTEALELLHRNTGAQRRSCGEQGSCLRWISAQCVVHHTDIHGAETRQMTCLFLHLMQQLVAILEDAHIRKPCQTEVSAVLNAFSEHRQIARPSKILARHTVVLCEIHIRKPGMNVLVV